jgi:RNA polymerase sigma factor (sigma-70 family)
MCAKSFRDLLSRACHDSVAAAELVKEYEPEIRRVVRFRLTDRALRREFDSLDVCQSVLADFFVAARDGRLELDSPEQLVALLSKMARNNLFSRIESRQAAKRDIRRRTLCNLTDLECVTDSATPSMIVADAEQVRLVKAHLSQEEWELLEGRAANRTWADLAQQHGGHPDRLRVRLQRAMARMRQQFGIDA